MKSQDDDVPVVGNDISCNLPTLLCLIRKVPRRESPCQVIGRANQVVEPHFAVRSNVLAFLAARLLAEASTGRTQQRAQR